MKTRNFLTLATLFTVALLSMLAKAEPPMGFGSDVHANVDNPANNLNNLSNWLQYVAAYGSDYFCLAGDQVASDHDGNNSKKQQDYSAVCSRVASIAPSAVFKAAKGNHDLSNSDPYGPTYNYEGYGEASTIADFFTINSDNFASEDTRNSLGWWLYFHSVLYKNGKLKVVICHYPLHSARPGIDQAAATKLFDSLDKYTNPAMVSNPLDVVFVWGHTHGYKSGTLKWDKYTKMIAPRGQKIATCLNIGQSEGTLNNNAFRTLRFNCCNAGYIGNPQIPDAGRITFLWAYRSDRDHFWWERTEGSNWWTQMTRQDPSRGKW
jgi:hypothetical protein